MHTTAQQIQRQVTDAAVSSLFEGAHRLGIMTAGAPHDRFETETIRDVAYGDHPDQVLDVITPRGSHGPS